MLTKFMIVVLLFPSSDSSSRIQGDLIEPITIDFGPLEDQVNYDVRFDCRDGIICEKFDVGFTFCRSSKARDCVMDHLAKIGFIVKAVEKSRLIVTSARGNVEITATVMSNHPRSTAPRISPQR